MWFPNKDKLHHVYIIHNNTRGWFKFGISYHLEGRLSSLGRRRALKVYISSGRTMMP